MAKTNLRCFAENCIHNSEKTCVAGSIEVGGSDAETAGKTNCETFQLGSRDDYSSSNCSDCGENCTCTSDIKCQAVNCVYNSDKRCTASNISVSSTSTNCNSFNSNC